MSCDCDSLRGHQTVAAELELGRAASPEPSAGAQCQWGMPQEALSQHVSAARATTAKEVGAAMVAATACPLVLNWTDVIKTRMQSPPAHNCTVAPYSHGFSATGLRILREEGALQLWGTAMPASLLREVIVIGTRIGAYPAVRNGLSMASSAGGVRGGDSGVGSKVAAGVVLGVTSGALASPCDVVRIRLQAEAGCLDASGPRLLATGLRAGLPRELRHTAHAFVVLLAEGISARVPELSIENTRKLWSFSLISSIFLLDAQEFW